MLTACKPPQACQICRLQLGSLFKYGFVRSVAANPSRIRFKPQARHGHLTTQPTLPSPIRTFTTSRVTAEDYKTNVQETSEEKEDAIESVVRQARQTFGETLPKDFLSNEEYLLYERLYGPPLRETSPDDLEFLPGGEQEESVETVRNVLLRQNATGEYEEVEYDPELGYNTAGDEVSGAIKEKYQVEGSGLLSEVDSLPREMLEAAMEALAQEKETIQVQGKNQREIDAISRLQEDMEAAISSPIEEEEGFVEAEEEEYFEEDVIEEEDRWDEPDAYLTSGPMRTHPHTISSRSGTFPSTISLPQEQFVEPITELLSRTSMKHLTSTAERVFGGKGLPYSPSTPQSKKQLPQRHIGLDASQHKMSEIEADAYLAGHMPATYASVLSTLVEVRKRLGRKWIRDLIRRNNGEGPRVLDASSGGAGIIAWREILQAEWDVMKEEGIAKGERVPVGRTTVVTGSSTLRHRASKFLENTIFLPRLPDYIHSSTSGANLDGAPTEGRKAYDIIIAPHTLFPIKEDFRRKNMVQNLWSLLDRNGGVLILIEKGLPRGFEAIAGARSLILESHISSPGETPTDSEIASPGNARLFQKEEGMIIAPCTNHKQCPMYPVPGLSIGRKDFCHFPQRFIRPNFYQRLLGATVRNHEDVRFSYIAVRRGVDERSGPNPFTQDENATLQAFEGFEDIDLLELGEGGAEQSKTADVKFNPLTLPRTILPSLKHRGHVTLDMCTPEGKLERWIVSKSFSRTAYRDARKSKWGDLWALGAKTRVARSPKLGRLGEDDNGKIKGIRDGRMGKGGKKVRKNTYDLLMGKEGLKDIVETGLQSRLVKREKRTKGGRIFKPKKSIGEDDLG